MIEERDQERFIVIHSTKFVGKFSIYDTMLEIETPCHNYVTAKTLCKEWNRKNNFCEICRCDPCDCNDGCKPDDTKKNDPFESYWKMWGDK